MGHDARVPQAGWYADPAGTPGQRWWDGQRWTEHVHPPPPVQVSDPGRVQRQVQEQARAVPTSAAAAPCSPSRFWW
ncbi:MAG: DUF2510 domain-containing protein [Geodermatophilaceae bacterium]